MKARITQLNNGIKLGTISPFITEEYSTLTGLVRSIRYKWPYYSCYIEVFDLGGEIIKQIIIHPKRSRIKRGTINEICNG